MPAHHGKFVAYFRVSTDRQGKSGLGLEAQREYVLHYLDGGRWTLIAEFTEIESGKRNDRPELEKALTACKKQRAKLVIAKLDRLSRNLAFIATLMDSGVEFIAVDSPHANKLTIHKDPDFKKTHFKIAEAAKPVAKWLSEQFSRVLAEEQAEMAKMARPM